MKKAPNFYEYMNYLNHEGKPKKPFIPFWVWIALLTLTGAAISLLFLFE